MTCLSKVIGMENGVRLVKILCHGIGEMLMIVKIRNEFGWLKMDV